MGQTHHQPGIINDELFAMYNKHRGTDRGVSRSSDLLRELKSLCTLIDKKSKRARVGPKGERRYVTHLPTLADARANFCKKVDDPDWFA